MKYVFELLPENLYLQGVNGQSDGLGYSASGTKVGMICLLLIPVIRISLQVYRTGSGLNIFGLDPSFAATIAKIGHGSSS